MAIYHVRLKVFSRSRGESATAAAAYRGGLRVEDRRTGEVHDYTKRRGVERVDFFAAADAPAWASDPSVLFNAAEMAEVRVKNGCVAREAVVALPAELTADGRAALVGDVCRWLVGRYGVATMAATHAPDAQGDQRNHHCHILMTTRRVGAAGLGAKVRILDDRTRGRTEVCTLRAAVAAITNRHLAAAGVADRVDHRTLKAQANEAVDRGDYARAMVLTRQPTVHLGQAVTALRRRGAIVRIDQNAGILAMNKTILVDYLRQAEQQGRLAASPAGSRRQARADQIREATARVRSPSVTRPSVGPTAGPRTSGQGPGARVLASQARLVRRRQREEDRGHRRFAAMLERVRLDLAEADLRTLWAYCRMAALSPVDVEALVAHVRRDRACLVVLRRALDAREAVERARARTDQQRQAHGQAMLRTARARSESERLDGEPAPSRVRFLSRRQWADKRRHQRQAVVAAESAERREGGERLGAIQAVLRQAENAAVRAEAARRVAYPLLRDGVPMVEKIRETKSADVELRLALPVNSPRRAAPSRPRL